MIEELKKMQSPPEKEPKTSQLEAATPAKTASEALTRAAWFTAKNMRKWYKSSGDALVENGLAVANPDFDEEKWLDEPIKIIHPKYIGGRSMNVLLVPVVSVSVQHFSAMALRVTLQMKHSTPAITWIWICCCGVHTAASELKSKM